MTEKNCRENSAEAAATACHALRIIRLMRAQLLIRRAPSAAQLTDEMQAKMRKIEECLHCGRCKSKCPYGLDTPALLEKNYKDYCEILAGKAY